MATVSFLASRFSERISDNEPLKKRATRSGKEGLSKKPPLKHCFAASDQHFSWDSLAYTTGLTC